MTNEKRSLFLRVLFPIFLFLNLTSCNFIAPVNIKYVGVRSSSYGIAPFPTPEEWKNALDDLSGNFRSAQPVVIWIVGVVDSGTNEVELEFPSPGGSYDKVTFADFDKHESYLTYFDATKIKVFLQVEPGAADIKTLIDIVLTRYEKHPCVAGFGIDVEWYQNSLNGQSWKRVTDAEGKTWEKEVKLHNSSYNLLLKHYDQSFLCPSYRGNIIFVDDTQWFNDIDELVMEMTNFANNFYPNMIFYQIGYQSDKNWWRNYKSPVKYLGKQLAGKTRQNCGIIWVDFTLRDLLKLK